MLNGWTSRFLNQVSLMFITSISSLTSNWTFLITWPLYLLWDAIKRYVLLPGLHKLKVQSVERKMFCFIVFILHFLETKLFDEVFFILEPNQTNILSIHFFLKVHSKNKWHMNSKFKPHIEHISSLWWRWFISQVLMFNSFRYDSQI